MKAKRFKEFIVESAESNLDTEEGVRWWFGPESDMREVLGTGLWKLSIANRGPDKALEVMKGFAWLLQAELSPVIEKRGLWTNLWFRSDRELGKEEVEDVRVTVKINFRGQGLDIDCFKTSTGIASVLLLVGDRLTGEQLVQMVEWLEDNVEAGDTFNHDRLTREYADNTILKIKEMPNWPSDMTDWALEDW